MNGISWSFWGVLLNAAGWPEPRCVCSGREQGGAGDSREGIPVCAESPGVLTNVAGGNRERAGLGGAVPLVLGLWSVPLSGRAT